MLVVINRIPVGEVLRAGLVLLGLVLGVYLLWRIQEVVFLLFLAILLATAIEPIVKRLRRGPFTHGTGVLVVYAVVIIAITLPVVLLAPSLIAQGAAFAQDLPAKVDSVHAYAQDLQPAPLRDAVVSAIDRARDSLGNSTGPQADQLVEAGATAGRVVIGFVTVFVLAFYWMVERATLKRALLRLVPTSRARDVNTVWMEIEEKLGGWVRGQLILMLTIGVLAGVGYYFIGLPNPILLGVFAAFAEAIPMAGPFIAAAPAVLVALTINPTLAIVVVVYSVVIQQIESNVLTPRVMRHAVGISPLTVILGILIGSTLYGLPGAFIAVPIAGAVQVILAYLLRVETPEQSDGPKSEEAARKVMAAVTGEENLISFPA